MRLTTGTDPDVSNWAAALLPERIDSELRLPADTLLLYQALSWSGPLAPDVQRRARRAWSTGVSTVGYETEEGIRSWAERSGDTVARMLIVVRHPQTRNPAGVSLLPEPPPVPAGGAGDPCVLVEADVQEFVESVDGQYPVARDAAFARSHGHASVIIPGTLLMVRAARSAIIAPVGTVEMWFRHPVPVGAVLVRRRCEKTSVESLHLAGRDEPSVLFRVSRATASQLPPPAGVASPRSA